MNEDILKSEEQEFRFLDPTQRKEKVAHDRVEMSGTEDPNALEKNPQSCLPRGVVWTTDSVQGWWTESGGCHAHWGLPQTTGES